MMLSVRFTCVVTGSLIFVSMCGACGVVQHSGPTDSNDPTSSTTVGSGSTNGDSTSVQATTGSSLGSTATALDPTSAPTSTVDTTPDAVSETTSEEAATTASTQTSGTPDTATSDTATSDTTAVDDAGTAVTSSDATESTAPPGTRPFLMGADISSIPELVDTGATFIDTDNTTKSMLDLLKNHGFNAVRLRTFVNPSAAYGYAEGTGGSCQKAESYNDATHTAEFGAEVKAAGMHLLVDFHYSDTWADPGKQIIPEDWRDATSIDELATHVSDYTTAVLTQLIESGARPDMVQVGNETTPGMLIHVPGPDTDCWGNNATVNSAATGQASNQNWDNLATLFKAGIAAVRAVDPTIEVVLHIENTDDLEGVRWWVDSAVSRGVEFDILGLSAYTAFQGQPSTWRSTLQTIAGEFPDLEFIIAEYNPERVLANQIVNELPEQRGRGTFFWEPTQSGSWGDSMFTQSGNTFTARSEDFQQYDQLRTELGL